MKNILQRFKGPLHVFYTILYLSVALVLTLFNSEMIMVPVVGVIIILFALYRLWVLIKRTEKTLTVKLYLAEIALQVGIAAAFIYIAWVAGNSLGVWFGYLLGGLFIVRGTLYFYGTRVTDQTQDLATFFIHIAALIAGTYLILEGTFTPAVMSGIVITVALKRALKTGFIAYKTYKNPPAKEPEAVQDLKSIEWQETDAKAKEEPSHDA